MTDDRTRLSLALPGRWFTIDPRSELEAASRIESIVRELVGPADDAASARRRLRASLTRATDAARAAGAHGVFICRELAPGLSVPVTITVHAPEGMRLSPAIGTRPEAVIAALEAGLRAIEVEGVDTMVRRSGPAVEGLRLHRLIEAELADDGSTVAKTSLEAEYWFAVPGTKRVVLVLFASPLGELENALLHLFDSIALTGSFLAH